MTKRHTKKRGTKRNVEASFVVVWVCEFENLHNREESLMLVDMEAKVVLVGKDSETREEISSALVSMGIRSIKLDAGERVIHYQENVPIDLVIANFELPDMTGIEFVNKLRGNQWRDADVILYGKDLDRDDIRAAFRVGVNDVLFEPFEINELCRISEGVLRNRRRAVVKDARLRKLRGLLMEIVASETTEEKTRGAPMRMRVGGLVLDTAESLVYLHERPLELTPLEYDILRILLQRENTVVQHQVLAQSVRGRSYEKWEAKEFCKQHIRKLRSKIETDPGRPRYIHTVWGRGYMVAVK